MALQQKGRAMALLVMVASMGLGGCMGQMGLSGMVTKGNLSVVDNRYARAGVFMLLSLSTVWPRPLTCLCSIPSSSGLAKTPSPANLRLWWT